MTEDVDESTDKVRKIKVVPGSFLNLSCISDNPDNTIYSWSTGEQDLPVSERVLTLHNVDKNQNYTCTAESADRTLQATFMVILESVHG